MPFNLSKTNDAAALLTGAFSFAGLYLVGDEPIKSALGLSILAAGAILGYTGYSGAAPAPVSP